MPICDEEVRDMCDKPTCFECGHSGMFMIRVFYDDMYKHYDGEAKER